MKTVTINKRSIVVTAAMERALRKIASQKIVTISELADGCGRRTRYEIDPYNIPGAMIASREDIVSSNKYPASVRKFAKQHPRARDIVWDDSGRVSRIVKKL